MSYGYPMTRIVFELPDRYIQRFQALADSRTGGNRTAWLKWAIDSCELGAPAPLPPVPKRVRRPREIAGDILAAASGLETSHPDLYTSVCEYGLTGHWNRYAKISRTGSATALNVAGVPYPLLIEAGLVFQ